MEIKLLMTPFLELSIDLNQFLKAIWLGSAFTDFYFLSSFCLEALFSVYKEILIFSLGRRFRYTLCIWNRLLSFQFTYSKLQLRSFTSMCFNQNYLLPKRTLIQLVAKFLKKQYCTFVQLCIFIIHLFKCRLTLTVVNNSCVYSFGLDTHIHIAITYTQTHEGNQCVGRTNISFAP